MYIWITFTQNFVPVDDGFQEDGNRKRSDLTDTVTLCVLVQNKDAGTIIGKVQLHIVCDCEGVAVRVHVHSTETISLPVLFSTKYCSSCNSCHSYGPFY